MIGLFPWLIFLPSFVCCSEEEIAIKKHVRRLACDVLGGGDPPLLSRGSNHDRIDGLSLVFLA